MSQKNVEIAQALTAAWNAGDMDAVRAIYDPDVVVRTAEGWPEPGPFLGVDAVVREFSRYRETFEDPMFVPISFTDAGDRVVARQIYHGAGHGPDINLEFTTVSTHRNGRVILLEFFWDHAEALEVVGLSAEAMVHDNVAIVRAMLEAIGPETERDDWLAEFFDPEIEWHDVPTYPSAGVYVGREAFGRHAAEFEDAWADWGIEIEDIRAADDRVVARIRYRGVGKHSGAPITGGLETPATGAVFELRGGRILRVVQFVSHDEALEAVGLSE
jgi:ketosteroid isomerase-like protein